MTTDAIAPRTSQLPIDGLHTTYALDRVAGRFARLEDECPKPHADDKPVDLSGTFVAADQPGEVEVRVSTSGLFTRPSIQDSGNSSSPVRSGDQIGTPELL